MTTTNRFQLCQLGLDRFWLEYSKDDKVTRYGVHLDNAAREKFLHWAKNRFDITTILPPNCISGYLSEVFGYRKDPITGVISWWSLAEFVLDELIDGGVDVLWESYKKECESELVGEDLEQALESAEFDSTEVLVGFIYDEKTDYYDIDPDAEFSAIISNGNGCPTVQVVKSKHTTRVKSYCSPCYPNQADLDSGKGAILAYTLPEDMIDNS